MPEAAADVQQPAVEVDEVGQQLDRLHVGLELEDLGADVRVDARPGAGAASPHAPHRLGREPVLEAEAELRVELAGLDVAVGGGLDAGRDPDQDVLRAVEQPLGELDLGERVEHEVADPGVERELSSASVLLLPCMKIRSGVDAAARSAR